MLTLYYAPGANFTAFKDRLLQRPAVRKVLEREQSPLWQ